MKSSPTINDPLCPCGHLASEHPPVWSIAGDASTRCQVENCSCSDYDGEPAQEVKLCSCCVRHGGFGAEPDSNTIEDEVVKCVECGEECQCNGCIADYHGLWDKDGQESERTT